MGAGRVSASNDIARTGSKKRRWLRWWAWVLIGLVVVAVGSGGFVWVEHARSVTLGETGPIDGIVLATSAVTISSSLPGYVPGRGTVTVMVDGTALDPGQLVLHPDGVEAILTLADGRHDILVEYASSNVFSRLLSRSWGFTVDTTAPTLKLVAPSSTDLLEEKITHVEVEVDEPATVALRVDDEQAALDPAELSPGPFVADLSLPEGDHTFALVATDAVGNSSSMSWESYADYETPVITAADWPEGDDPWTETSAAATFTVVDTMFEGMSVRAEFDGAPVTLAEGPAASGDGRSYGLETGELTEGRHAVALYARDRAGHEDTWTADFLVDSSSSFGLRTISLGAVGNDVSQLQGLLSRKGFYEGKTTGTYDEATANAVAAYNAEHGLDLGGTVGKETLALMRGSIRIDVSERKLYHYSDGELRKTYSVAVGMPAYPTPTGSFRIISKVVDPTWTPPDSDWAEGMEPVGPGPGNPLGTRWMGIDSPSVGIHGTYNSSSIGTAASHGCIRMHVGEAEELYRLVYVGTPVEIVR